jgi:hypothetical protein
MVRDIQHSIHTLHDYEHLTGVGPIVVTVQSYLAPLNFFTRVSN